MYIHVCWTELMATTPSKLPLIYRTKLQAWKTITITTQWAGRDTPRMRSISTSPPGCATWELSYFWHKNHCHLPFWQATSVPFPTLLGFLDPTPVSHNTYLALDFPFHVVNDIGFGIHKPAPGSTRCPLRSHHWLAVFPPSSGTQHLVRALMCIVHLEERLHRSPTYFAQEKQLF